ncbi:hypothetical protein ZIOFF_070716 [Zingiber officinale]|uniref:Uncharacterized protein n=1 Tax=Zingiber officinale TaxID=94328 RepID=A0A8J5EN81_ZINOF|nr:hypothetical protein ZIOFF_070716 [Zingiber officinale]
MAEYGETARHVAPAELVAARQFTVPYAINLTLTSTGGLFSPNDHYKVKDTNGDVVFMVKGVFFSNRRLLLDTAGNPLHTMKPKAFSWHGTWRVFRGESTSPNDLLFSVRKPKVFQWKDNFDVVLATNTDEASPGDFKIISRSKKCTICIGQTDEIIAQHGFRLLSPAHRRGERKSRRRGDIVAPDSGHDRAEIQPRSRRNPATISPESGHDLAGIRPRSHRNPAAISPGSGAIASSHDSIRNPAAIAPDSTIVADSNEIAVGFRCDHVYGAVVPAGQLRGVRRREGGWREEAR